jgi:ABC-type transport system involved in cytochrome bd biosynthesis fused ATPase/permease subunit
MKAFKLMLDLFDNQSLLIFVFWQLVSTIVGAMTKYVYSRILKTNDINLSSNMIYIMLFIQIVELQISPVINNQTDKIVKKICIEYKKRQMIDFNDNISAESKEKFDINRFDDQVDRMCDTVSGITHWFFPNVIGVIVSMSLAFFTFDKSEFWVILLIIVCQVFAYQVFYKPKQEKLGYIENECRKERERAYNQKTFILGTFEMGLNNFKVVQNYDLEIKNSRKKYSDKVREANIVISYASIVSMSIAVLFVSNNLKAVVICMSSLTNAINNMMNCISWMTRTDSSIDEFDDKKSKLVRQEKPKQKVLSETFTVTNVNIPRGRNCVKFSHGHTLQIEKGDHILIHGSSGHGKSTFLKGLLGHINSVFIDDNESQIYTDNFITVAQGGNVRFDKLTVADLFGTRDEKEIEKFCHMALLDTWLFKMKHFMQKSWLDAEIQVSGGEHKRLTIAYKLFLVNKYEKRFKVITLDEPEQGSDLYDKNCNDGYEMLRRIGNGFPNKILIIVSHMYDDNGNPHVKEVKNRSIKWTKILSIDNFVISVKEV